VREASDVPWARLELAEGGRLEGTALRWGRGEPRTVVLAGLHGDETTGLYVLRRLVEDGLDGVLGTVDVLPVTNPLGLLMQRRDVPVGGGNLNRAFGGAAEGALCGATAEALLAFVRGATLVVDLHAWETPSCVVGVVHEVPPPGSRARAALAQMGCDYVWKVAGAAASGTLGERLAAEAVATFAMEYPPAWLCAPIDFERWARCLGRALRTHQDARPLPPMGGRLPVAAPAAGLFDPLVAVGERVKPGQHLARLVGAARLAETARVVASCAGIVMHLENRRFVQPGDVLAFVGTGDGGA